MSEEITQFDIASYLKSPEDMAAHLGACCQEDSGDGSLIRAALSDIARAQTQNSLPISTPYLP